MMHCGHSDGGVNSLGEGVLKESQICPTKYASDMGVQLDVYILLVMRACDGDCGGESYFDRCVDGGQHRICLGVSQGDEKAG